MKVRKNFITENTKINLNEEVLKIKVQELFWELFVDYVNKKYKTTVIELNIQ